MVLGMTQPTMPDRTIAVATIHSLAAHFAADPTIPMPTEARFAVHDLSATHLLMYAAMYGQPIQSGGTSHWITVPMASVDSHTIRADYTLFGPQDESERGNDGAMQLTDAALARRADYNRHNAALAAAVAAESADPAMVELEYEHSIAGEN